MENGGIRKEREGGERVREKVEGAEGKKVDGNR